MASLCVLVLMVVWRYQNAGIWNNGDGHWLMLHKVSGLNQLLLSSGCSAENNLTPLARSPFCKSPENFVRDSSPVLLFHLSWLSIRPSYRIHPWKRQPVVIRIGLDRTGYYMPKNCRPV